MGVFLVLEIGILPRARKALEQPFNGAGRTGRILTAGGEQYRHRQPMGMAHGIHIPQPHPKISRRDSLINWLKQGIGVALQAGTRKVG